MDMHAEQLARRIKGITLHDQYGNNNPMQLNHHSCCSNPIWRQSKFPRLILKLWSKKDGVAAFNDFLSQFQCNNAKTNSLYTSIRSEEILYNAAKHKHGNYVIQHLLEKEDSQICEEICLTLTDYIEELATDVYGSFVIEKCLLLPGGDFLLRRLIKFDVAKLERMATDCHGNYVLQTALKSSMRSTGYIHFELVRAISRLLPLNLLRHRYAGNVLRYIVQVRETRCAYFPYP